MVKLFDSPVQPPRTRTHLGAGSESGEPQIQRVDPGAVPEWNRWCRSHADGSVFHSTEWMTVLEQTYLMRPASMIVAGGEYPTALIPMLEVKTLGGGRKAVGLPFTDGCKPLVWEPVNRASVWKQVAGLAKEASWNSVELRGGMSFGQATVPSLTFFGHSLDLTPSEDGLFRSLKGAFRTGIRKAEREGLEVRFAESAEAIQEYYQLHCETRKRHGLPPQPFGFFRGIYEQLIAKGLGFVATATLGQLPVAAAVFFQFGRKAVFKFGASKRAFQHMRANNLVMWEAVKHLRRHGCEALHLGRTSRENEGLRRFKQGLGGEEHLIEYSRYDLKRDCFVRDRDQACGWHTRIFRAMPLWLARIAGCLLYRRFA